jgi:hypothetical protein
VHADTQPLALRHDLVVDRLRGGGHDDLIERAAFPRRPDNPAEHGAPAQRLQNLAG